MSSHRSGQSSAIHNEMRPAKRAIKFEVVKKKLMRSSSVLMFTIQSATDSEKSSGILLITWWEKLTLHYVAIITGRKVYK